MTEVNMKKIRWGIVGTGNIAHRFARAICHVEDASLRAVASRNIAAANAFGDEFSIPVRFGSYEEMAQSGEIDAVYIAVPHGLHADTSILFLKQKTAVLCEKPLSVNKKEAMRMIACAKENDTFLMEAMWANTLPGTRKLKEIAESGQLGDIMGVQGSFCYNMDDEPEHHVFQNANGGGGLLDVGVYGLTFASWFMKSPVAEIKAAADVRNGVDVHCTALIRYEDGAIADISSALLLRKPNEGYVFGTKGYMKTVRFYAAQEITLCIDGEEDKVIETPFKGNGFEEEIEEVDRCLLAGKKESELVPHSHTLFIMEQMDEIRRQIGVAYPQD